MGSIAAILPDLDRAPEKFVVEALSDVLDAAWVEGALRASGRESQRERLLPAPLTLWLVVLLALFRRHSCVSVLNLVAESLWARRHWPDGAPPSGPALTQARDRLGPEPARLLFETSAAHWVQRSPGLLVAGHRVMGMDGSTARTPDSERNRAHFGLPASKRGRSAYPQMRAVLLTDLGTRLTVAVRHGSFRTGEMTLARSLLGCVPREALVVMDRNFTALGFLWELVHERGAQFVVRIKRTMKACTVRRLGPGDRLVRVRLPRALRRRRPELPARWVLREVTYVPEKGHEAIRVLTSLLDPSVLAAEEVARTYGLRWGQETALDEIKTHLLDRTTVSRPVVFRGQRPSRVEQEIYAILIAHNVVRMVIGRAAAKAGKHPLRLSFTATLRSLREAVAAMSALATPRLAERYERFLLAASRMEVPLRPGRSNPREVKIKMSSYPCKGSRRVA